MSGFALSILTPIVLLLTFSFLIFRLKFFFEREIPGKYQFISGSLLMTAMAFWQAIKSFEEYDEWFLEKAYFYLDLTQFLIFVLSVFLLAVSIAFYADYWQMCKDDIDTQNQKLSILANLQRDAREPYHLMELLNIAIKEMISQLPDTSGAVFLINRPRRQFVLTASAGLSQHETALLERYPLERNIVSQAIDLGEPMLTSEFNFYDVGGKIEDSRFKSALILPFVSGSEKIGGIILFSEQSQYFRNNEIRYLLPVANWLAEKINSTRLSRELSHAGKELEQSKEKTTNLTSKLLLLTSRIKAVDSLDSFCRELVGFNDCGSAHLYGLYNGSFTIFGESEPLLNLSENYRTALIDALDKNKPLIINQESQNEDGRSHIILSSLIYPVASNDKMRALLLRKESDVFKVTDFDLKGLEIIAQIARIIIKLDESTRLNVNRRKGFEQIIKLLQLKDIVQFDKNSDYIIEHLNKFLPSKSISVAFQKKNDGSFVPAETSSSYSDILSELHVFPGEGELGLVASTVQPKFITGRNNIGKAFDTYENNNKDKFLKLFGEKGLPLFMASCPVTRGGNVVGVIKVFIFESSGEELPELERLIRLAIDLYSTGLTIDYLYHASPEITMDKESFNKLGSVTNQLNNYLSAVIGNAELALTRDDISGETKNQFRSIISEAESASRYLKKTLGVIAGESETGVSDVEDKGTSITDIIQQWLSRFHISDTLYMIGGTPREINLKLNSVKSIKFVNTKFVKFFEETINRFSSVIQENDMISINSYEKEGYLYLDISHHRKNFPSVEAVAGFGKYLMPEEVIKYRPSDTFLKYMGKDCYYSFDKFNQYPSYLSFKFPLYSSKTIDSTESKTVKILAIDDQPVILELLTAMFRSMGDEIVTAQTGQEGISLFQTGDFDIVLTDLAMPGISGLDVAKKIRILDPEIPIILLTGWEVKLDKKSLDETGINRVLYKPFRIEQLTNLIKDFVGSKSV